MYGKDPAARAGDVMMACILCSLRAAEAVPCHVSATTFSAPACASPGKGRTGNSRHMSRCHRTESLPRQIRYQDLSLLCCEVSTSELDLFNKIMVCCNACRCVHNEGVHRKVTNSLSSGGKVTWYLEYLSDLSAVESSTQRTDQVQDQKYKMPWQHMNQPCVAK